MGLMRVKLTREEPVRWLQYNEYLHEIRRAVHESDLPVERSGGAEAWPRIEAGYPLQAGHTSRCEYVDLVVCLPIAAAEFGRRLDAALPEGIRVLWQRRMPPGTPALKAAIQRLRYRFTVQVSPRQAAAFVAADAWPLTRIRKGKERTLDLKQSIPRLRVEPERVILDIAVRPEGMPKPDEAFASVFGVPLEEAQSLPTERIDVQLAAAPPFRRGPDREQP
jgi:radical SAM-linked protein